MFTALTLLTIGLVLLIIGAELLVRGASKLASTFGISPLVIGLTVVAFGTSSPELAISTLSAMTGKSDIALGNVAGSNIFNVLLILGASSLITPLLVSKQLVRLDVPIMIGVSFLVLIFGYDGSLDRLEGLILFGVGIAYTIFIIKKGYNEVEYQNDSSTEERKDRWLINLVFLVFGLGILIVGSRFFVNSVTDIATFLGVSQLVIGLTVVAAGTSLPEVATSIVASIRGERDIAVGNIVGSNIFNIVFVLGITCIVAPDAISLSSSFLRFDLPIMIAVAIACLPIFFTGYKISRWEGVVFISYYIIYTLYLFLSSSEHELLPSFSVAITVFVIPLTLLTIGIVVVREIRGTASN